MQLNNELGATVSDTVSRNTRFWTHASVIALCTGAWGGAALLYFESSLSVPLLLVGVAGAMISAWCAYRAVKDDPVLSEEERVRVLRWFKSFGPAAVVQLLLFIHFPNSKFAGH